MTIEEVKEYIHSMDTQQVKTELLKRLSIKDREQARMEAEEIVYHYLRVHMDSGLANAFMSCCRR